MNSNIIEVARQTLIEYDKKKAAIYKEESLELARQYFGKAADDIIYNDVTRQIKWPNTNWSLYMSKYGLSGNKIFKFVYDDSVKNDKLSSYIKNQEIDSMLSLADTLRYAGII